MSNAQPQSSASSTSNDHGGHDVAKDVRKYVIVFITLIIGTILTVLASYHRFPNHSMNIALALAIACVKVFLVAGFFMHLISERQLIYTVLIVTAFFFAGLMYLTLWSMEPNSIIHIMK